jgi:hypothetical protein
MKPAWWKDPDYLIPAAIVGLIAVAFAFRDPNAAPPASPQEKHP